VLGLAVILPLKNCNIYKKRRFLIDQINNSKTIILMSNNNTNKKVVDANNPLTNLDEWEMDVLKRYPDPDAIATNKATEAFRNYEAEQRDTVKEFYRLNHQYQSYDFVLRKKTDFLQFNKK
jgi:hypothetical protein